MKAFIPKNLFVEIVAENTPFKIGSLKRVRYVAFSKAYDKSKDYIIEQYYHSNFARHQRISITDLEKIDGYEKITDDTIGLYEKVFPHKKR